MGLDSRTDAQGNPLPDEVLQRLGAGDNAAHLTDTLILLHIARDRSRAVAFSIPRDSYVRIPGGYGQHKINSAYARGKAAAEADLAEQGIVEADAVRRRSTDAGRELLVETMQDLTGVSIDHYAEVNLLGFARITRAVGGVPVCLNEPVYDPYSGADFEAGRQKLVGAEALAFVRQRHGLPRGGLDRVVRQQAFMAGLARSVLSADVLASPSKLSGLIDSVQRFIVLDQGWNIFDFARQMQGLAGGDIVFHTIPIESASYETPDGTAIQVERSAVQTAIQRAYQGLSPEPTATQTTDLDAVVVDVRNTTDYTNLAARVRNELDSDGVPVGEVANADPRQQSLVYYAPGAGDAARYIAEQLDGMPITRDTDLTDGEVRVLLGADYDGPGRYGFAPQPVVTLDGAQAPSSPGTVDEDAITADGIPCVN